jgi:hypothetical protein
MLQADWQGFYGPAYRLLLTQQSISDLDEMAWKEVVRLHERNPVSEGHWEFLALGYLHLCDKEIRLSPDVADRVTVLSAKFQARPHTRNWRLMAQVVKARLANRQLRQIDIAACGLSPTKTGFLPDELNDSSSQYHAYMLALIMRFGDPCDEGLRSVVERASQWLVGVYKQHGDPSPLGRGRFQVFGYAAMAVVASLAHKWKIPVNLQWQSAVWHRCHPEPPTGSLSAVWTGPFRKHLLHGYNTTDDYPAFAALWLKDLKRPDPLHYDCVPAAHLLWWHRMDHVGSGILANSDGPIAALQLNGTSKSDAGLRNLSKALLTRFGKPQSLEYPPILLESSEVIHCGGFMISRLGNRLVLQSDSKLLKSSLVTDFVTLWSPQQTVQHSLSGSCELEYMTWQRPGTPIWHGLKARIVRHGHLQVEWAP